MVSSPQREPATRRLHRLVHSGTAMFWLLLVCAGLVLVVVGYGVQQNAQARLTQTADEQMTRLVGTLETGLARHSYLAVVLAQEPALRAYLAQEPGSLSTGALNEYLAQISALAGTLDVYLLDAKGTTVAASNWYKEHSFIGNNFAFRPYFKRALQGLLGRYYAVGTTSNERGYYFASAVHDSPGASIGVVTVKVDIAKVEQQWNDPQVEFLVTDPDGIVFMGSRPQWLFQTIKPLPTARAAVIRASLKYANHPLQALPDFRIEPLDAHYQQVWLPGGHYLLASRQMITEGWDVHVLVDWQSVSKAVNIAVSLTALLLGMMGLLVFLLWKYRSQRRRYEQAALEALETKVEERTRELRVTQEELVQAAKMAALGQLSAAINHELNNPLGAIRAYADNASQFLALGRLEMAGANLQEISALTERMAAITRQLKAFSRKSAGHIEACSLHRAVDSALLIVQAKLSQTDVVLQQVRDPALSTVQADRVWLEQILVNLLSNALEAVAEQGNGQIWLSTALQQDKGLASITVQDNGSGISAADMPHVFEAFFTTKSIGKGLGLGLSISYRLAKDMHGELQVKNAAGGGAAFTLVLPAVQE